VSDSKKHLPVSYTTGGVETGRTEAPVQTASDDEMALYAQGDAKVCGGCKYFEHTHGQAEIQAQKFVERLVREENWQVKHLCSPVNQLGICGAHDSGAGGEQTLTGTMHKACDQYRPNHGRLSLVRRSENEG
jgi:hypothetical protein